MYYNVCLTMCRYLTGQVDQRTIEKYQQEAKDKAGSSWYLAFIMDTNEDERAKVLSLLLSLWFLSSLDCGIYHVLG